MHLFKCINLLSTCQFFFSSVFFCRSAASALPPHPHSCMNKGRCSVMQLTNQNCSEKATLNRSLLVQAIKRGDTYINKNSSKLSPLLYGMLFAINVICFVQVVKFNYSEMFLTCLQLMPWFGIYVLHFHLDLLHLSCNAMAVMDHNCHCHE